MAFNKAPSQSTYQTKDVKLLLSNNNRDKQGTKDVIGLNGFYDLLKERATQENDYMWVKRDGTTEYPYSLPGTDIRGMFFWEEQDKLLLAYDTDIDIVTASTGVFQASVTPFATTTGEVGFSEFYYDDGSVKIVVSDGVKLATIDSSNTLVIGSDPDQPATMSPFPVYLDGYLFVTKAGTSDIYNSNLNDPLVFTPGDFITAEMLPDELLRIARLNNYIVALGTASIEYFWDAANASGSPLQRNDTPLKQVGYLGGLVNHANRVYFVAQTANTEPEVMMLEDFKIVSLDNPPLRRYIQPYTSFNAAIISMGGHDFYVLSVGDITYMMDLDTRIWTRLAFQQDTTFPIKYAVNLPITGAGNVSLCVVDDNANLYYFNPTEYDDEGVNFTWTLQTNSETFDTLHEKYMSRLIVFADRPTSTANLDIQISDDDYQTYSSVRSVNLNQEFPCLQRLGRFRRRAFKLSMTANVPGRLHHLEVDFNIGNR